MTIEIKQLVIRAVVEERRAPVRAGAASAPPGRAGPAPVRRAAPAAGEGLDREDLIAECTRQVLRELRRGQGR